MSTRETWQRRLGPLYGGAVALVHSTSWRWPADVGEEARSPAWVVALGVPVGLAAWAVAAVLDAAGVPTPIAALCGLAMLSGASAGLVERGLAERVGQWSSAASSVGPLGVPAVLVLVFSTLIRGAAIASIPQASWLPVFLTVAVAGRWAAVFLQALGERVDRDDAPRSFIAAPSPAWLTAAISGGVLVLALFALGKSAIAALALAAIAAFSLGLEAQRRDGGLSSAVVATAAAVSEFCVLLIATIR